jgi:simple sugar transport system permease protein
MFISGCLAGVAGMLEVAGTVFRLQPTISADYGFSAFIIAWIGRLSVPAIAVISYFFGGLLVAGFKMQMMGFPSSVTFLIKGLVLILVLAGELLTFYRIYWVKKGSDLAVGAGGTRASPGRGEGETTTDIAVDASKD